MQRLCQVVEALFRLQIMNFFEQAEALRHPWGNGALYYHSRHLCFTCSCGHPRTGGGRLFPGLLIHVRPGASDRSFRSLSITGCFSFRSSLSVSLSEFSAVSFFRLCAWIFLFPWVTPWCLRTLVQMDRVLILSGGGQNTSPLRIKYLRLPT